MYFRCSDCLTSTWLEVFQAEGTVDEAVCAACARLYLLRPSGHLGTTVAEHYRNTLAFSRDKDLDAPSSYAVLLGIMSFDQAQVLRHARFHDEGRDGATDPDESEESEPAPAELPAPVLAETDPTFLAAIEQGHLTLQEALRRGDRDLFALNLTKRHGMSRALALRVADNRISLRKAIWRVRRARARKRERAGTSPRQKLVVVGAALVALAAVSWDTWQDQFAQPRRPVLSVRPGLSSAARTADRTAPTRTEALRSATRVRTDDQGRVLEVVGPDPGVVLARYCESVDSILKPEPLELVRPAGPSRSVWLGLFRDPQDPDVTRAIRIRQDYRTHRWVVGDGNAPIEPGQADRD